MKCSQCRTENPDNADFCKKCGKRLNSHNKQLKDVEFTKASSTSGGLRNKILIGVGVIIVIFLIVLAVFAFAKTDAAVNVNSAFYVNNIIDKQPVNGKFLIMNVSVENKGNDTITVSNDQFVPMINGSPVNKYSVYSGDGTDIQKNVQISSGQTKDLLVIFDIGDQKPDSIEYHGPVPWVSSYKTSTKVNTISLGVPFDGMFYTGAGNIEGNGQKNGINVKIISTNSYDDRYEKTDDPNVMKLINKTTGKTETTIFLGTGQTNTQDNNEEDTNMININTGLLTNGTPYSNILPKNLTKKGDSFNIDNETYTIIGSEKIDILGHKIDCWKVEATINSGDTNLKAIKYYDKTTRMVIKQIIEKQNVNISGVVLEVQGDMVLKSTNMPLIGVV